MYSEANMSEDKELDLETARNLYQGMLGLRTMMLKSKEHIKNIISIVGYMVI